MPESTIVRYINNEPIYQDSISEDLEERDNGCVQGPPCPDCFWANPQGCTEGVHCSKPESSPCPD